MASSAYRPRHLLVLAALAYACGGGDLTLPNQGQPATVELFGDRQNGSVGEALVDSLVVRVEDRFGEPVPNVTVTWSAEGGGSVDPTESITDADGRAATERVLGPQASIYFTIATVDGLEEPVTFTSTGLAARLVITSQLPAIAVSGAPLSPQPELQLQDADGSPLAEEGVVVTVQIVSGGGTLDGATSATSDATGHVAFTDLAIRGSPGTRRLIFAAIDFAPATSAPIALGVGAPASIEPVAGDDQEATVGEAVPVDPAVRVLDEEGNPLGGIPVTFTVTAGDGTVDDNTPVTDASGVATVGAWRLGGSVGANELSAEVVGQTLAGSPVVFSANGTPGAVSAERSTVSAAPSTISASSGSSVSTITVTARDQFGNPLAGIEVSLAVSGGPGATLTQPSAATNANGVATGRLSAITVGNRTVSATAGGVALEETATVTVSAGVPSSTTSTATVPNGQAGQTTTIQIQLRDAQGNLVAGRAGAIAVSVSGANNIPALAANDQGGGQYTVTYTPEVAGTDQVAVVVSGGALPGSPFPSVVAAGPTSAARSFASVPASVSAFSGFTITVHALDQFGNPVGHGGDPFALTIDGSPIGLTDNGNGTYSVSFGAFSLAVGQHSVDVTLAGSAISGSPYPLTITFP